MGNVIWAKYPKVTMQLPGTTDPKEASWVSDPLDQYFDKEECWNKTLAILKAPPWTWVKEAKLLREAEWEFTVMEKVTFFERNLTARHIINPRQNMVESRYFLSKEFPKYPNEDPLFLQWLIIHSNPLRVEGWRRRMDQPDLMIHDEGTMAWFNELLKALVTLPADAIPVDEGYTAADVEPDPEKLAAARNREDDELPGR
eukprot:CAMPEP_0204606448 /NCGR_PEP_ID=MMETSP0661-20131031/59097_1 /ASSEMBLY_ACC=CAM_ASM_000606 /TAXON_ID=109239 /ORGANISM="Alexandrium margalefi, Strain AMGDE01CS-322" /LENGTH=199 /DNA_ID=CAMNT_0051617777 /DNA_START=89 /DNA_END=688 /DNA_ORIENTATION=-